VSTVDLSGAVQGRFFYSPYGETTSSGSSFSFQYTGRVQVSSALYYYRARFYSPVTGRFISEDPIGFSGGTANLYEYTGSSPTQFTDPLGLRPQCPGCDLVGPDNACTRPCCKAHDECFSANNCAMWSRFGGSEECRQCNAEVDRCLVPCGPMHPELRFNWPPWRDRRRRSTNTEAQSINPILRLR
jgi:RHS repeat-associated protein